MTLFVLFLELMEELTTCDTTRLHATVDTLGVDFLAASAVEIQKLEEWSEEPDVVEGDNGKGVSPLSGNTDTIEESS